MCEFVELNPNERTESMVISGSRLNPGWLRTVVDDPDPVSIRLAI
jgi:hypothetical protein